jgi:excisionase family DNA binding protein
VSAKRKKMNVNFENLNKIEEILITLKKIEQNNIIQKRWLSVKELSEYINYSKDRIYSMLDSEFIENKHFYRKGKILFDRLEVDAWITSSKKETQHKVEQILKKLI